ncbi:MAG: hypothetical protein WCH39_14905 [Schlesneria sp.]
MKAAFFQFFGAPVATPTLALGGGQVMPGFFEINTGELHDPSRCGMQKIDNATPIPSGDQLSGDIAVLFPGVTANWW